MQEERYGTRDMAYSAWHRRNSTQRFVGIEQTQLLAMIDMDVSLWVEYDDKTKIPLALVETAIDVGQPYKSATVALKLAERANIPCFVLLYSLSPEKNPAAPQVNDISQFRLKRLRPNPSSDWEIATPQEWAERLLRLRKWCTERLDKKPPM